MVDDSIVTALVRTVFSIPQKEWTESDIDVIKKHLEGAMQYKGLTRMSEIVVKDLLETLEMLKKWNGPEPSAYIEMIERIFKERQPTVQVSVPMPTVSSQFNMCLLAISGFSLCSCFKVTVAKCLSLSLQYYSQCCSEQGLPEDSNEVWDGIEIY